MDTPTPESVEVSGQATLDALSGEQRAHYQLTGELPKAAETPAAEPDDDDEPESQAQPAAKSEPTPEKPISKRQQQINDLIRRATESDLRAKALEAEISALKARQPEPKAEPKAEQTPAVAATPAFPVFDAWIAQAGNEAKTFEDYIDARADFRYDQRRAAEQVETKAQSAKTAHEKRIEKWIERRDAFAAKTPGFVVKAGAFLDGIETGTPIGDALVDSEVGPALALYLAEHPDEVTRIVRLPPVSALRALGALEHQITTSLTSASASAGPAAKTVTTAPAPPMTLTPKAADPADDVESALASRDFRAYEAAQNRRELART